jgi:site-specific recombinase XerD
MADKCVKKLAQAISDYLQWLISERYSPRTCEAYEYELRIFLFFIRQSSLSWDEIFTFDTLKAFQKDRALSNVPAVRGLARYLFRQKRIFQPMQIKSQPLPKLFEQYLSYYEQSRQNPYRQIKHLKKVLASFHDYLERQNIELTTMKIEHLDAFMAEFYARLAIGTCRVYRSYIRGFLTYLYRGRKILSTDFAPLLVGRRVYSQPKPPKFLRSQEVRKLFAGLKLSSPAEIRTYAMVHLAYTLGLRPIEISKITLDDISFSKSELTLADRKGNNPMTLPVPEQTIKAIAAYLIHGRPDSQSRYLFLNCQTPYRPVSANRVVGCISKAMKQTGLESSSYWLRHTYAQNLLVNGESVFEIKEMLGHDKIESTKNYLRVNIKMMRKVLFDETL